jgi:hypothetical protein
VSLARSRKLSAFFNGRSEIAEKTRVRITVVFRTLQSAFALAETAGVAHGFFGGLLNPSGVAVQQYKSLPYSDCSSSSYSRICALISFRMVHSFEHLPCTM